LKTPGFGLGFFYVPVFEARTATPPQNVGFTTNLVRAGLNYRF
jgi:hypothetical protein